jgi:NAD(P)-dependent dehydrogenase (short-subunit alcohol dehydrogenase family)
MDIKGKVILVTGANRGIGKAYVEELVKAGAKKIYLGVRKPEAGRELERCYPGKTEVLKLDVANPGDVHAAARSAPDVEIVISNAGVLEGGSLLDADISEHARREMEVNYFGPLGLIQAFAPVLKGNGGGAFVAVASIAGLMPFPSIPTYSASKYAMHCLIMEARMELAAQNTKVFGVYPGPVDTDMTKGLHFSKVSPNHVAVETIKAMASETEDIMPDPYAAGYYGLYKKDPKAVEMKMRSEYVGMTQQAA